MRHEGAEARGIEPVVYDIRIASVGVMEKHLDGQRLDSIVQEHGIVPHIVYHLLVARDIKLEHLEQCRAEWLLLPLAYVTLLDDCEHPLDIVIHERRGEDKEAGENVERLARMVDIARHPQLTEQAVDKLLGSG